MKSQASNRKVTIQFMSKKEGDSQQELIFETKKEAHDQLAEKVIPLTVRGKNKWIVAAKSSHDANKDARQVSVQELTTTDSHFYTQLVKGELDQILVSPPVLGG